MRNSQLYFYKLISKGGGEFKKKTLKYKYKNITFRSRQSRGNPEFLLSPLSRKTIGDSIKLFHFNLIYSTRKAKQIQK